MVDHTPVLLALRKRLLTLSVCTTNAISLSATSTGYARTTGSFVSDGFAPGMEVRPSGFTVSANNNPKVVIGVTPLGLTVAGGCTPEDAADDRTLSVGLPRTCAWENVETKPIVGWPVLEEDFVPATSTNRGMTSGGVVEDTGLYVIRWYGVANVGNAAVSKAIDALLKLFSPGTAIEAVPAPEAPFIPGFLDFDLDVDLESESSALTLILVSDSDPIVLEVAPDELDFNLTIAPIPPGIAVVVRVRGDVAPFRSQAQNDYTGRSVVTASIPYRVFTLQP